MATTTNFGWETPDDTDLVKDGAAAIRTALGGVDTSFVDLKGGTTGQVLAKASNTDLDYSWTSPTSGSMTQLATGTLSGSSVVVSSLSGSYKDLKVIIRGFKGTTSSLNFQVRINNDSTANRHTQSSFTVFGSGLTFNQTFINGVTDGSNSGSDTCLISIDIPDYANTTTRKFIQFYSISPGSADATALKMSAGNGGYNQTSAITGLTFLADGGTFNGGTYFIYGVN